MVNFRLCHDLNKHTSDRDSISELHPTSYAVVAIGPGNIYDRGHKV
jgi:hypothetical protein